MLILDALVRLGATEDDLALAVHRLLGTEMERDAIGLVLEPDAESTILSERETLMHVGSILAFASEEIRDQVRARLELSTSEMSALMELRRAEVPPSI